MNEGHRLNVAKRRIQAALRLKSSQPLEDKVVGELLSAKLGVPILPSEIRKYILECGEDSLLLGSWGPELVMKKDRFQLTNPETLKKLPKKARRKAESEETRRKKKFGNQPRYNFDLNRSKSFYESESWRSVRYEALKRCGRKCLVCGRGREHGIVLHVDHIKPRSRFPELALDIDNLQVLCEDCNLGKSNRDSIDWR